MHNTKVAPEPLHINFRIAKTKRDGSFNLTAYQLTQLAVSARQAGKETTWELDGSLIVWEVTEEEFRGAVAYLGMLGRAVEVSRTFDQKVSHVRKGEVYGLA